MNSWHLCKHHKHHLGMADGGGHGCGADCADKLDIIKRSLILSPRPLSAIKSLRPKLTKLLTRTLHRRSALHLSSAWTRIGMGSWIAATRSPVLSRGARRARHVNKVDTCGHML